MTEPLSETQQKIAERVLVRDYLTGQGTYTRTWQRKNTQSKLARLARLAALGKLTRENVFAVPSDEKRAKIRESARKSRLRKNALASMGAIHLRSVGVNLNEYLPSELAYRRRYVRVGEATGVPTGYVGSFRARGKKRPFTRAQYDAIRGKVGPEMERIRLLALGSAMDEG